MRDPARIDRVLAALRAAWMASPDLRLGQLLTNVLPPETRPRHGGRPEDDLPYHAGVSNAIHQTEDDAWERALHAEYRAAEEERATDRRAGRRTEPLDVATLARIVDLRCEVDAAVAALVDAAATEGTSADEIVAVLTDLRRRAVRWRLTDARVRAQARALVAALHVDGVPARDPRAWIDTDERMLIVFAGWGDRSVAAEAMDGAARRVAEVLGLEAAAVRVGNMATLGGGLGELVWMDGTRLLDHV